MTNILDGYRVLDCSIAMAGPFAAQRLGDLGADVVKIEPIGGEWQRHKPAGNAKGNRINVSFLSLNRNKRSLAIDLKSAQGKAVLLDLVRSADVFLQNYRPGVAARLGVDYDTLKAINPKLIYVSVSGYGESGPYALRPGQDLEETGVWDRRDEIFAITQARLHLKTTQAWLTAFQAVDIWCGPVYGYADIAADPQIAHNGTMIEYDHPTEGHVRTPGFPIKFEQTPSTVRRGAPLTGEHSREILSELGYDDERIEALLSAGSVGEERL